jgi:hypothetical protein
VASLVIRGTILSTPHKHGDEKKNQKLGLGGFLPIKDFDCSLENNVKEAS